MPEKIGPPNAAICYLSLYDVKMRFGPELLPYFRELLPHECTGKQIRAQIGPGKAQPGSGVLPAFLPDGPREVRSHMEKYARIEPGFSFPDPAPFRKSP